MSELKKTTEKTYNETQKTCNICLSDINCESDNITIKWTCGHVYHIKCINQWKNNTCPMCRCNIPTKNIPSKNTNKKTVLNMSVMKHWREPINVHKYRNLWNDRSCITNGHSMFFCKSYGVHGFCENCETIQCYGFLN